MQIVLFHHKLTNPKCMSHKIKKSEALPQKHLLHRPQFAGVATDGECENFLSIKFSPDVEAMSLFWMMLKRA